MIGLVLILVGLNLWNDSAPINPTIRSSDNSGTQSSSLSRSFPLPYRNDTHEGNKGNGNENFTSPSNLSTTPNNANSSSKRTISPALQPRSDASKDSIFTVQEVKSAEALSKMESESLSKNLSSALLSKHFPTADQRVRFYMSSWYEPPCDQDELLEIVKYVGSRGNEGSTAANETGEEQKDDSMTQFIPSFSLHRHVQSPQISSSIIFKGAARADTDVVFALDKSALDSCEFNPRPDQKKILESIYCPELRDTLLLPYQNQIGLTNTSKNNELSVVLLAQVGDALSSRAMDDFGKPHGYSAQPTVPHFTKVRLAWDNVTARVSLMKASPRSCSTLQTRRINRGKLEPIIWKMGIKRHYKGVEDVPSEDVPWEEKRDVAVFRGTSTGDFDQKMPARERCRQNQRCRLVLDYHNSSLVDAKFTNILSRSNLPLAIDGIPINGSHLQRYEQLRYKALIFMEGNDVSTGLKWGLYSNSVVMITKPSISSWAMEELLEPYVHYVPLRDDLSDVETQMKWIVEHDREAKEIALRGQLWMHDLLYAEESERDNAAINEEILRRYQTHFRPGIAVKEELLFYPKPLK
jgi:hypothetical protein